MPPSKYDSNSKQSHGRPSSLYTGSMSARVYHPATNLMPPSPPQTPTGTEPTYPSRPTSTSSWSRQNSSNGKQS